MRTLNPEKVGTLEPKERKLTKADIQRLKKEVRDWKSDIATLNHENSKMTFQRDNMSNALSWKLKEIQGRQLAIDAERLDVEHDITNSVTFQKLSVIIERNLATIERHRNNIIVREKEIAKCKS